MSDELERPLDRTAPTTSSPLLEVDDLRVHFAGRKRLGGRHGVVVRAVDGVSFAVQPGETVAVVGESGCGKTTLARAILRVNTPTSGTIRFRGTDVFAATGRDLTEIRRDIQIVFQDATSAMNPRMRVSDIIGEPLRTHARDATKAERRERVAELMQMVSLDPKMGERHPHEFSGGQRQRIAIARALAVHPALIVCDESVAALDVSIQAQIINLLQDLKEQLDVAYLFISHDLSVVYHIADRVVVMYLGRIVEEGPVEQVLSDPQHPYTRGLLEAVPVPDPSLEVGRRGANVIRGEIASAHASTTGCAFAARCPIATKECTEVTPELRLVAFAHTVACIKAKCCVPAGVDDDTSDLRRADPPASPERHEVTMTTGTTVSNVAGAFDGGIAAQPDRWHVRLDASVVSALAAAGRAAAARPLRSIDRASFVIPGLDVHVEQILRTVSRTGGGPGFAVVDRIPVRDMTEDEVRAAYWILGLHLGNAVTQNKAADLIADVRMTETGGYRGFNTSKGGRFHCDFTALGGLLSRRRAREGGRSSIASAAYVHNSLLARDPDLAAVCYEPFALGRLREEGPDDAPFSTQPVFARDGDRFGMFFNHALIVQAQEYPDADRLSDRQVAACDAIDEITQTSGAAFEHLLEEGQIMLFNNHQVLHSRTSFDDFEEPDERRHLLRLWLEVDRLEQEVPSAVHYDYRFGNTGLHADEVVR